MRKLLTLAASAAALTTASVASAAIVPVTFTGDVGAVSTPGNTSISSSPIGAGGQDFTITLDYDDVADAVTGATIMIGSDTDDAEIIRASVINVPSSANPGALDTLEFDLISTDGSLPGNFSLDFEFFNTALDSESVGSALSVLANDMGALICSHIMFNFGGFKYEGTLAEGGITFDPANPIPLPGAAVFMLSGLAAAGVARRRRAA